MRKSLLVAALACASSAAMAQAPRLFRGEFVRIQPLTLSCPTLNSLKVVGASFAHSSASTYDQMEFMAEHGCKVPAKGSGGTVEDISPDGRYACVKRQSEVACFWSYSFLVIIVDP